MRQRLQSVAPTTSNDCEGPRREIAQSASRLIRPRDQQIQDGTKGTASTSIAVARQCVPDGLDRRAVLQANRRQYRGIAGNRLDCASASPWDIDKYLSEAARLEESKTGRVTVAGMLKVKQFVRSSLRKLPSQLHGTVACKVLQAFLPGHDSGG
jgi:hypothetical protein